MSIFSINSVNLAGRLGSDVETKDFDSGATVANFVVCVTTSKKIGEGQWEEIPHFVPCVAWNGLARAIASLGKGKPIAVSGRIEQQRWETPEGENRSKLVCNVNAAQFDSRNTDDTPFGGDDPEDDGIPF